jgi:hypothetical protein
MISSRQRKLLWATLLYFLVVAHQSLSSNGDHLRLAVDAFNCNLLTRPSRNRSIRTQLYGVQEWRAKYSSNQNNTSSSQLLHDQQEDPLPLLLLPFNPSQILLPGQRSSYKFRHGKYMDLVDESITKYESVIGMSILSDDGLLPITVLCEVIEEELEINMGYRGFSSMEVGIRALGRVRRCDVNNNNNNNNNNDNASSRSTTTIGEELRTTALDDIHQGKVVDWSDEPLDAKQKVIANEYRKNIKSILRLRQAKEHEEGDEQVSNERLRRQQRCYESAYDIITLDERRSNNKDDKVDDDFTATSWAAFAAATAINDHPGVEGSVNIDALSTTDTVERLWLGLAMLLENQMPRWSEKAVDERYTDTRRSGGGDSSASIPVDGFDTFQ